MATLGAVAGSLYGSHPQPAVPHGTLRNRRDAMLAAGAPGAGLTREARASLQHLAIFTPESEKD